MDFGSFFNPLNCLAYPTMHRGVKSLENISDAFEYSERMPVLFLGHGSPMNGIEDNEFVRGFMEQGSKLPRPNAILVVSAHWETRGTYVTAMPHPRTIHDFGGFPRELYEVQYPAPGDPELASEIKGLVKPQGTVHLDDQWGLDHGSWTVVKHLFPEADVPVIQLSLDRFQRPFLPLRSRTTTKNTQRKRGTDHRKWKYRSQSGPGCVG